MKVEWVRLYRPSLPVNLKNGSPLKRNLLSGTGYSELAIFERASGGFFAK